MGHRPQNAASVKKLRKEIAPRQAVRVQESLSFFERTGQGVWSYGGPLGTYNG